MLVFRSLLQTNKVCFLKINTRHNRFVSQKLLEISQQCLSNANSQITSLHTRSKPRLQQPNIFESNFFSLRHLTQDPTASKFIPRHEADKISKHYKLIYANGIFRYYQLVQFFLYPMSMVGVISSGNLIWTNYEDFFQVAIDMGDHPFVAGCTFFIASSAMLGVFVNVCQRALVRIYINPQTGDYVAIRFPWNFLKAQISFTPSELEVGGNYNFLPFNRSNLKIKGRPFLIVNKDFVSTIEYNKFVGSKKQMLCEKKEESK